MSDKNKHNFLAEELLSPNADKSDTMRLNMFDNHIAQSLILSKTDYPYVFTNFENQVGKYSTSYKVADSDFEVVDVFERNSFNKVIVLFDRKNNFYDILEIKEATNITEKYGYQHINPKKNIKIGTKIAKGETLWYGTAYDEKLNYGFGRNLKTVYLSSNHLNFEDGIIISQSAKEKLSANTVNIVEVSLNPNDIMLNIYGNENEYKAFPNIGEDVADNNLIATRRFQYDSFLYDLKNNNLRIINRGTDSVFNASGKVIDIEIFSNMKEEELGKDLYNAQLNVLYSAQKAYYVKLFNELNTYGNAKSKYSENYKYLMARSNGFIGEQVWTRQRKEFSGIVISFTILNEMTLEHGDKISNR